MPSRQNRLCVLILLAAVALAALAVSSALAASARSAATVAVPRLVWHRCASPAQQGFQCATARVPRDYDRPHRAKIHLAVVRHRATDPDHRVGTLFVNFGGPGASGLALPQFYSPVLPAELRARFDIVSWDPRATGESTAVHCFATAEDEASFLDGTLFGESFPVGKAEMDRWIRRYRAFGRHCERRNGTLLRHVSTADSARDMNLLRRAVGDRKLSYWGISYGTILGATYANLFPKRVRALVLDGNLNPKAYVHRQVKANGGRFLATDLRQRSDQGTARTLAAFLDLCGRADTAHCAFSAGSAAATRDKYATLLRRLRRQPQSADVTYASVVSDTGSILFDTPSWPDLAKRLQDVWTSGPTSRSMQAPKDSPMSLRVADRMAAPALAASAPPLQLPGQIFAIRCSESPNPDSAGFRSQDRFAYGRSGPLGPWWSWVSVGCATWPASAADRYAGPWDRRTANPVLVIGNTFDPSTPYRGALAMTRQLARARLLTVDGYGHTELFNPSTCANRYATNYLIKRTLPPKGTRCKQDQAPFGGTP
jgi:pimeloyl-ACP methyl ester carboxylesterase